MFMFDFHHYAVFSFPNVRIIQHPLNGGIVNISSNTKTRKFVAEGILARMHCSESAGLKGPFIK